MLTKMSMFFLVLLVVTSAFAQSEKLIPLGKYDFYHYYTHEEITRYLKDINKAFPKLTEIRSMCKSQMGRDVWMLVINNPETGKEMDKPGFFLNQIHSSEVIASMSCNYTIWHLLDNYGRDDNITDLVDNMVWYIVPRLDVDGAEAYLTGKPAGKDPNPVDNDGDFSFDEDPPEDLDGDGVIVQMRKLDPEGNMKISDKDPRIMTRKAPDENGGEFYMIYTEGIDNDGDGKYNEDSYSTRFLSNRNYPGNWKPATIQGGSGKYPLEETVTMAEYRFVADHPNITLYVQHHCCGRVILTPPSTMSDAEFQNKNDLRLYKIISARSLEHSTWGLATSVHNWNFPPGSGNKKSNQIYRDKDGKIRNAPAGMYPESNRSNAEDDFIGTAREDHPDRGYFAWGSSLETTYDIFGIFSMATEHWASTDYDKNGSVSEEERFRWNDEEMDGQVFVDWHTYDHPTLGEVEIGGWPRTKTSPPEGELIQKECEMGNDFIIYLANQRPKIEFGEIEIIDKKDGVYQLDISVKNEGFLPTETEQAFKLKVIEPTLLKVEPGDDVEIIYGEEKVKLGKIDGFSESDKLTYILRVKRGAGNPSIIVSVTSQRAGKVSKQIAIK
ncbi:M14 family metallopeptidase, partial [candidate division KSB1 bacterium]